MAAVRGLHDFETLTVDVEGAIAIVTLDRPELLNRFDDAQHVEFIDVWSSIRSVPGLRAVVLAARGRAFSAGGDFSIMELGHSSVAERLRITRDGYELLSTFLEVPQPVIAAVQGAAIGLAATIVLSCDAVVAARAASISDPHVNIGLVAGDGGCAVWPAATGMVRAKRHLLTGDPLSAEDAHHLGLVTDLVDEPDDVLPAAMTLASKIAGLPPLAVQLTKRTLNRALLQRCSEVLELGLAYEVTTMASDDLVEAIDAFRSRRPARYQGQ